MAGGRIAGITIEIGGDTTKLQSALKGVDRQLNETQKQLRDVNRLLKLDPGNTELLRQKQKALADAVSKTKDRLNTLKDAQKGVAEGSDEWDRLQREIIDTEQKLKGLERELRNFGSVGAQQLGAVGQKMKSFGKRITDAGRSLSMFVTAPIVAAGVKAVSSFAEVDKTMQLVNATMKNTVEQAAQIEKAMEEAAANSTFGMTDAATATLNFARAGLDAAQAAAALAPAMNLAAGEGGSLDTVSAGLVGTINAFQDSFDRSSYYADVFAAACNNSALDVNSLSENMASAGTVFAAAGYDVEDLALYMGIMANNSIGANESATALASSFGRLVKPTADAQAAMDKIGFSLLDDTGKMKDARQVLADLQQGFSGLDEAQQIATASAIFGKNHYSKWLALIGAAPEDVDDLAAALENSAGTADEMAAAMMGGFGGSIEKLKSSVDVLSVSLGRLAAKYLTPLLDKVQGLVDKFNGLSEEQQGTIVKIAGIAAVLGPLLIIVGSLITSIGAILTLGPLIVAGIGMIFSPISLLIAGIAAVLAISKLIVNNWDTVKMWALSVWEEIKTAVAVAVEGIKTRVAEWIANTAEKMAAFRDAIRDGIAELPSKISQWFTQHIVNPAKKKVEEFKNLGKTIVDNIKSGIQGAWEGLASWFNSLWDRLFKNRTVDVSVNASGGGVGSYATGLNYVPFDGFPAILHRGEAVLTAQQAADWRSGDGGGANIDYDRLAAAIASRPIVIEGDTAGIFRLVQRQNGVRARATGYNALALG